MKFNRLQLSIKNRVKYNKFESVLVLKKQLEKKLSNNILINILRNTLKTNIICNSIKNYCILTSKSSKNITKFKLSKYALITLLDSNYLFGLKKSSW